MLPDYPVEGLPVVESSGQDDGPLYSRNRPLSQPRSVSRSYTALDEALRERSNPAAEIARNHPGKWIARRAQSHRSNKTDPLARSKIRGH